MHAFIMAFNMSRVWVLQLLTAMVCIAILGLAVGIGAKRHRCALVDDEAAGPDNDTDYDTLLEDYSSENDASPTAKDKVSCCKQHCHPVMTPDQVALANTDYSDRLQETCLAAPRVTTFLSKGRSRSCNLRQEAGLAVL